MFHHTPEDMCPFSTAAEYNQAMRSVYQDFEPIDDAWFAQLKEYATNVICPPVNAGFGLAEEGQGQLPESAAVWEEVEEDRPEYTGSAPITHPLADAVSVQEVDQAREPYTPPVAERTPYTPPVAERTPSMPSAQGPGAVLRTTTSATGVAKYAPAIAAAGLLTLLGYLLFKRPKRPKRKKRRS